MGYYTAYRLEIDDEIDLSGITQDLRSQYDDAKFAIDNYGSTLEDIKWYNHKNDLTDFSIGYPDKLFRLVGEGEENGDVWILYVKNGKSFLSRPKLVWPKFDETMLI